MNDLVLYIFSEKGAEDLQYTFVLEERDRLPVIGNRTVPIAKWKNVIDCYPRIQNAVEVFMKKIALPEVTDQEAAMYANAYKHEVENVVKSISDLLMTHFWPETGEAEGDAFASRFLELERESACSENCSHLLIATNDSKIPWWLVGMPRADTKIQSPLICESFALGMISLRTNQAQPNGSTPPINVRIITCPTVDLAKNFNLPEVCLDKDTQSSLLGVANYALLSGRVASPLGQLGLDKEQVKKGFKDGRLVLYHGHFKLTANHDVGESSISASGNPPNRENDVPIKIRALETDLRNKDIIFIGCETAGMHPGIDQTLGEYLAKRGSTLTGTLYPVLDDQARSFANELSKGLFLHHLSWGESVRRARDISKKDGSLFYRAAYCYFGVPWQMSPLFGARMNLHVLIPSYLESVYETVVKPEKVYSSIVQREFVPPAQLEQVVDAYDKRLETGEPLFIAALPSVFVAELLRKSKEWVVLGPMVASAGDVRIVSTEPTINFDSAASWEGKKIVFKGPHLTASAFLEVLLHKKSIKTEKSQWRKIPTDCSSAVREGLAEFGLIVGREDLAAGEGFPGRSFIPVDTELAKAYDGQHIPRILWVTKKSCMESWRRFYIDEFFKRLSERINDDNRVNRLDISGSELPSTIWLYRMDEKDEIVRAKQTLSRFLKDWADLDERKERQVIPDENWYDWSTINNKPQP